MRSTTDPHGDVVAYSLLAKADELVEAGRYEEAAQPAIEHLRRNPDEPQGLAALGKIAPLLGALGPAEHFPRAALAKGGASRTGRPPPASAREQQERPVPPAPIRAATPTNHRGLPRSARSRPCSARSARPNISRAPRLPRAATVGRSAASSHRSLNNRKDWSRPKPCWRRSKARAAIPNCRPCAPMSSTSSGARTKRARSSSD